MFNKLKMFLTPVIVGAGGLIVVLPVLTMNGPGVTLIIVAALVFFSAGILVGKMQPQSLWYAPLLMNVPLWLFFLSVHGYRSHVLHSVTLLNTYIGMFIGSRYPFAKATSDKNNMFSVVKMCFISFFVGILGMPLTYLLILIGFGAFGFSKAVSTTLPFFIVNPLLALILGLMYHNKWLTSTIIVCLPTILYISYFLFLNPRSPLWVDGTFKWSISFENDTGMLIILPLMLIFSCFTTYVAVKLKKRNSPVQ